MCFLARLSWGSDGMIISWVFLLWQYPIDSWHDALGDATFADAILDRLVHNAYKLKLKGGSMRKKKNSLTQADH